MAHRIAFLHEGRIEQCGALREFYESPATLEAACFFGWQILVGTLKAGMLQTALGCLAMPDAPGAQGPVWAAFRPEAVRLSGSGALNATVETSIDLGDRVRTSVSFPSGETIEAQHTAPELEPGRLVAVSAASESVRLFARAQSGRQCE